MVRRRILPVAGVVVAVAVLVVIRVAVSGGPEPDPGAARDAVAAAGAAPVGLRFTDVTARAGLDEPHGGGDLSGESAMTSGVAAADVDRDGDVDLYLTRVGRPDRMLLNDGTGRFTDGAPAAGLAKVPTGPTEGSSAAAFADVEGDGDLDLVRTPVGRGSTELLLNDGAGRFSDATGGSGLDDLGPPPPGRQAHAHGLTFADVDRDGRLDLLVTHWDEGVVAALADPAANDISPDGGGGSIVCARAAWLRDRGWPRPPGTPPNRSRLYLNEGGGRFRDATAAMGLPLEQVMGFTGSFADVDRDGWPDLLLTGDFCTSRLFRNEGGTRFVDVTRAAGVGTDENGMGSVVRDIDGDGDADWFVTGIGPVGEDADPGDLLAGYGSSGNRLYLNDGSGSFTDATDRFGVRNGGWGWGAAVADLANTGRPAVLMTNGYSTAAVGEAGGGTAAADPLLLWAPGATGRPFTEAAARAGLTDTGIGHGMVTADVDGDGDLDVVVANFGTAPRLYRNDSPQRHWIAVRLDDPTTPGNRQGVGARVVVVPEGAPASTQEVATGGSYESQVPAEVHVGLGRTDRVARVEVTWPGSSAPQVVEAPPVDRVLTVTRPSGG